jgi:multiple sugar transport system substrate-binding protein
VTKQSKSPAQAAELAKWLMTNDQSALLFSTKQFLFPSKTDILSNPAYVDQKVAFFGGQQVNKLYAGFSDQVGKDYSWSPFQDYVYQQMNETLGKAIVAKGDLGAALDTLQAKLVSYAKAQGFTVTEN